MRAKIAAQLIIAMFFAAGFVGGCASKTLPPKWNADDHVIAVNEKGETVDPNDWKTVRSPADFDHQLKHMFCSMQAFHKKYRDKHPGAPLKILVFIHGGLNNPYDALQRASDLNKKIGDGYYPIFVVWNSDLGSSYGEHLWSVRQGRYEEHLHWMAPFYFIADFGRALVRAPIAWTWQARNDIGRITAAQEGARLGDPKQNWVENPTFKSAVVITDSLLAQYQQDPGGQVIKLSIGEVKGEGGEGYLKSTGNILMYPIKYLVSPILDGCGSAAWDNMYRRAEILFDGFTSSELASVTATETILNPGKGALVKLIDKLHELAPTHERNPDAKKYEITLIGHSMGTIVLSEMLRRSEDVDYRYVVYMAAACSVRSFQQHVLGYLEHHHDCQFYNLCLHPTNELRESNGYEVPPRGSLLVWIDDMFENPRTPLDRTLGRWENVVETSYVIPADVRRQVNLKAFGVYPDDAFQENPDPAKQVPQKHGQFTDATFWSPRFWQPEGAEAAGQFAHAVKYKAGEIRQERFSKQQAKQAKSPQTQPAGKP